MEKLPGYDDWLTKVNGTKYYDIRDPDPDTVCMKCGQYILDEKGKQTGAWDCSVEYDSEWKQNFWYYWHDNCQK